MLMSWLPSAKWVWPAVAGTLLVLVLGQRVQVSRAQVQVARTQAEFAEWKLNAAESRVLADRAQRAEEQRREDNNRKAIDEAVQQTTVARADAERAAELHERVRRQLEDYRSAVRRASTGATAATGSAPAHAALDLLAELLSGSGADAAEVARFADAAHIAGRTCQRIADDLSEPIDTN